MVEDYVDRVGIVEVVCGVEEGLGGCVVLVGLELVDVVVVYGVFGLCLCGGVDVVFGVVTDVE